MKRKDAILLILNRIHQTTKNLGLLYFNEKEQIHAEELLSSLEAIGMQPPSYAPKDIGYVWGDTPYHEPNGFKVNVHKWEPENEKNWDEYEN